ncbi:MAG: hypothetical protein LJE59_06035 [Chromatiaceae bacterium]|nr:hypothetical protein [Chromatiaceae bacterium]
MRCQLCLTAMALLLAACAGPDTRSTAQAPVGRPAASADEALASARDLAQRGQWSQSIAGLDAATRQFPEDATLAEERGRLAARWEQEQRALEDQIVVADAENQYNKIALLEKLVRAQPDDLYAASRRLYWKEALAAKLEPLTKCAEAHVVSRPELAQRCVAVASQIPAGGAIDQRLARVTKQLKASESLAAERRRLAEEKERQARVKALLDGAKKAIDERDYRGALDTLDKVAAIQPNNKELAGLREQAWSMITPQVEALVKLGDNLYLNEQLGAAVATWQAALTLKPGDEDILARVERATTVLNRLDELRHQQQLPDEVAE